MDETPDVQDWVGAWWLGFVICGFSSILLAFFIFLLPSKIPGVEEAVTDDDQV